MTTISQPDAQRHVYLVISRTGATDTHLKVANTGYYFYFGY
jgi:hypothetical protein